MDGEEFSNRVTGVKNVWDVVVIGAGPAGSMAALLLARRGLSTLLVDRKTFPREKVCGGCLNARAVAILHRSGVSEILDGPTVSALNWLQVHNRRRRATIALPGGAAIDRSEFDQRLASCARASGATLMTGIAAAVAPDVHGDFRRVALSAGGRYLGDAFARVVLAADGLGNTSLSQLGGSRPWTRPQSRVGVGAIVDVDNDEDFPGDAICMAIDREGYVGRVRLGDGRMIVAAALDARAVRALGPAGAINRVLTRCGHTELASHASCVLRGTPPLTCEAARVADERVFVLGDACGYVEPFTGDGMAIALETAVGVVSLVQAAQVAWRPKFIVQWRRIVHRISANRRRTCRALSAICRHPGLVDVALAAASKAPGIFSSLVDRMNRPPQNWKGLQPWECTSQV